MKLEKEKTQVDTLLAKEQSKTSHLEDKVSHLAKSLEKIEQRNHELQTQVNDLQVQKESDARSAQAALRDQEK